jgi:hypothetical protein
MRPSLKVIKGQRHGYKKITFWKYLILICDIGLDHERLTSRYAGRDFRLTDVAGQVAKAVFA